MISLSVTISPAALRIVVPPKLNPEAVLATPLSKVKVAVAALPIVVVPVTPAAPPKVPICLIVIAEAPPVEFINSPFRGVVTPILAVVIVPDPLTRVRLSVAELPPVVSASIALAPKSIFPSLTVELATSVVIVTAPSIFTAPSKSTSPTLFVPLAVSPAVVISPFKTIKPPAPSASILTSSIPVPLPIPPAPTVTVPVVLSRVTSSYEVPLIP